MKYIFLGGQELFEVELKGGLILLKGEITNHKQVTFKPELFKPDRRKMHNAKLLLLRWPKLTQTEREVYLCMEFSKMGYVLKEKVGNDDNVR